MGFLGSALIFKNKDDANNVHEVHGLTTAASVWLSAAVGIACAGGMYFVASLSTAIMLVLLRFGPRTNFPSDDDDDDHPELGVDAGSNDLQMDIDAAIANLNSSKKQNYHATHESPEKDQLIPRMSTHSQRSNNTSTRRNVEQRPSLI